MRVKGRDAGTRKARTLRGLVRVPQRSSSRRWRDDFSGVLRSTSRLHARLGLQEMPGGVLRDTGIGLEDTIWRKQRGKRGGSRTVSGVEGGLDRRGEEHLIAQIERREATPHLRACHAATRGTGAPQRRPNARPVRNDTMSPDKHEGPRIFWYKKIGVGSNY